MSVHLRFAASTYVARAKAVGSEGEVAKQVSRPWACAIAEEADVRKPHMGRALCKPRPIAGRQTHIVGTNVGELAAGNLRHAEAAEIHAQTDPALLPRRGGGTAGTIMVASAWSLSPSRPGSNSSATCTSCNTHLAGGSAST